LWSASYQGVGWFVDAAQDGRMRTAGEMLAHPEVTWFQLAALAPALREVEEDIAATVEADLRFGRGGGWEV
jgi:hypothetical protein